MSKGKRCVYHRKEVPEHCRWPYIVHGYREYPGTYLSSLCSLNTFHNESINIWSNLIVSFLFIYNGYYTYHNPPIPLPFIDLCIYAFAHILVAVGFFSSALYHTLSGLPFEAAAFYNKVDYAGIFFIGFGAALPGIYFGFAPFPLSRCLLFLLFLASNLLGMATIFIDVMLKSKPLRMLTITLSASTGFLIIFWHMYLFGFYSLPFRSFLYIIVIYYIMMFYGALVYASHIPERYFPYFDTIGNSHNIWHLICGATLFVLYYHWSLYITAYYTPL